MEARMSSRSRPVPLVVFGCLLVLLVADGIALAQDAEPSAAPEQPPRAPDRLDRGRELQADWYATWEKYTKAKDGTPEKEALRAEVERIAKARRALYGNAEGPHAPAGAADEPLARLPGLNGTAVSFSPDGKWLLVAGGREARVWDAQTFKPTGEVIAHHAEVWAASFDADGSKVLTAGGKFVRVWDRAGRMLAEMAHPAEVRAAAFSADGSTIASGAEDGLVRLWDASTGKPREVANAMKHASGVRFVSFAPAGDLLLSANTWRRDPGGYKPPDPPAGMALRAWDARSGEQKWAYEKRASFSALSEVALSPDVSKVLTIDEGWRRCELLDARTGKLLVRLEEAEGPEVCHPAFSPDGARVAIAGWGQVQLWDVANGKKLGKPIDVDVRDWVTRLAFNPDGRRLLVCARSGAYGADSQLSGVWDVATRAKLLPLPAGDVVAGAFSPDGTRVATGFKLSEGNETTVWKVPDAGAAVADAGKAAATIPGKLPDRKSRDWSDVFDLFLNSDLPKDLPLPAKTPFDADANAREDFHRGYRMAFVDAAVGTAGGVDTWDVARESVAYQAGVKQGLAAGHRLHTLREKSEFARVHGFRQEPGGHLVTDQSPEEERKVLKRFNEFAAAFEQALRALYPQTVQIEVPGVPRLYAQQYDDYSADNTGSPRRVHAFKGVLDSRRPGNYDWMRVSPKDPAHPGPGDGELQGRYGFTFDYDLAAERWTLLREPYGAHEDGDYWHMQQTDVAGRSFRGTDSKVARELILKAIRQANGAGNPGA
jgi:WD40 repeat protein